MTFRRLLPALLLPLAISACVGASSSTPAPTPLAAGLETGIYGRISDGGGAPHPSSTVYAYRNPDGNLRGPADFAAPANDQGDYLLDCGPGDFYLVARSRRDGGDSGPPRPGDAWALPESNPVRVTEGVPTRVDFRLHSLSHRPILGDTTLTGGKTGVTGLLLDAQGRPVGGAFVLAYRDGNRHRMPDHTSLPAREDGRFTLYLPTAGDWCLAAREKTRGQPQPGEPYGIPEGNQGCPTILENTLLDIGTIVLKPYRR
jgi:hypothetical protein